MKKNVFTKILVCVLLICPEIAKLGPQKWQFHNQGLIERSCLIWMITWKGKRYLRVKIFFKILKQVGQNLGPRLVNFGPMRVEVL